MEKIYFYSNLEFMYNLLKTIIVLSTNKETHLFSIFVKHSTLQKVL